MESGFLDEKIMLKIYDDKVEFTGTKSLIDGLIWNLDNL